MRPRRSNGGSFGGFRGAALVDWPGARPGRLMESRLGELSRPVAAIEGIGRRLSEQLGDVGVFTVADLLRVEPGRLSQALDSRRSVDVVRSWCRMAAFLQIRVMTPQWAEALYRSSVYTPRDLFARDLPTLKKLFAKARDDGVIPDVPDDRTIAEMMKEAAELAFTGAVNGTIVDETGSPVADASVSVGREHEVTDDRGRFRIAGIPFGVKSTLAITHPECRPTRFRLRRLQPSDFRASATYQARRLAAGQRPPAGVLREARGDALPPLGDARVEQREVNRDELYERDIFALTEFSADRQRGKLVSKLLGYEDGDFWLPYVWVQLDEIKRGAKAGDCFVLRHGTFEPIEMNPIKLRGWPAMLKSMRQLGPPPATPDEIEAWLEKAGELLQRSGRRRERH